MKKTIYNKVVGIVFLAILFSHVVYAQNERNKALIYSYLHGWEYSIKAGLSIGGTSPLPLPKEIRSIDSYAPNIAIAIEGNATKWFGNDKKWGMTAGIRLENKTMTTEATVKNYGMKIINTNGGELQGLWTGGVKTKVKNSYLTIPLLANYKISDRWKISLGPYFSYMTEGNFSGLRPAERKAGRAGVQNHEAPSGRSESCRHSYELCFTGEFSANCERRFLRHLSI